jgi:hypothetical protein
MAKKNQESRAENQDRALAVLNPHLHPALDGKFRIVGTHCEKVLNTSIGDIDFRKLTEAQAEQLVEDGFIYLEKISS